MPDTKTCVTCGKEFTRLKQTSKAQFAIRTVCRECKQAEHKPETKVCEACGKEYSRQHGTSHKAFAARRVCSMECREKVKRHPRSGAWIKKRYMDGRLMCPKCDCGLDATGVIWVIQLGGNGKPCRQYIEVCADCRDLFLETDPGASMDKPPEPKWEQYTAQHGRTYHAPAHWFRKEREVNW
jgi:hypothetical protein